MNWQKTIPVAVIVYTLLAGCDTLREEEQGSSDSAANVVTEDIQDGIEKHIEEQQLVNNKNITLGRKESLCIGKHATS